MRFGAQKRAIKPLSAVLILLSFLAGAAFASQATDAIGPDAARHLLNRTGFDAPPAQVDVIAGLSRREAADKILAGTLKAARTPAPAWSDEFFSPRQLRNLSDADRALYVRKQLERGRELRGWWITEMLTTPSPLTERMTLFWHNHFTSSLQKVRSSALIYRQNALLRQHALGNFASLLKAASKDPAMLVYLDSAVNRRGQPNENFAREVMELFTLGEGHYGEQDIREAARAFTGWTLDADTGEFAWRPGMHDGGMKTVLGRTGEFRGEEVLEILLARPETASFVVNKLWKEFVSPDPEPARAKRIAAAFRESGYDIKVALRELLVSDEFYAGKNRGALVKSPVDLVIGTMRQFNVGYSDPLPLALTLRALGQDLFSPPNVKGWPGGEAWINSTTLLARRQFLERLFRVDEARMQAPMAEMQRMRPNQQGNAGPNRERLMRAALEIRFSGGEWLRQFEGDAKSAALSDRLQKVLLPVAPASANLVDAEGVELIRRLTADPVYQLK